MDVLMDECTHNAEPPPQVWWEAETIITDKKMVADNTDLTIIIIIILRLYYICACMCVCYMYIELTLLTSPT